MPKISHLIRLIEDFAPLALQEPWDNSGLQIGDPAMDTESAVITLDITLQAVQKAIETDAKLIISHHPLMIASIRNITPDTLTGKIILLALRHQIAIYSSHTSMDSAPCGINQWLAETLELQNIQPLTPGGLGRTGTLPHPLTTTQFTERLKQIFALPSIRTNAQPNDTIYNIALCGGSGGTLIPNIQTTQADTYICGDLKYHHFQEAPPLKLFDIGHFESENQFSEIINHIISENLPTFAIHKLNSNFTTIL